MESITVSYTPAEFHLSNWAKWMSCHSRNGYPSRSALLTTGGVISDESTIDSMCEAADAYSAVVTDSVIDSLDRVLADSIRFTWNICRVWHHQSAPQYDNALVVFWKAAQRKGLC